jgi:hypothetical protein
MKTSSGAVGPMFLGGQGQYFSDKPKNFSDKPKNFPDNNILNPSPVDNFDNFRQHWQFSDRSQQWGGGGWPPPPPPPCQGATENEFIGLWTRKFGNCLLAFAHTLIGLTMNSVWSVSLTDHTEFIIVSEVQSMCGQMTGWTCTLKIEYLCRGSNSAQLVA